MKNHSEVIAQALPSDKGQGKKFNASKMAEVQAEVDALDTSAPDKKRLFKIQRLNDVMKEHHAPLRPMFDSLFFEGEISILFADTNLGKSILAIQIAHEITAPSPYSLAANLRNNSAYTGIKGNVVIFDFEMTARQFQHRYKAESNAFNGFSENIFRATLDISNTGDDAIKDILNGIQSIVEEYRPQLIIIDNITYLLAEGGITAKEANKVMKGLKALKDAQSNGMSILVVAHTPKTYDKTRPIQRHDLAGSANFASFAVSKVCHISSSLFRCSMMFGCFGVYIPNFIAALCCFASDMRV